MAELLLKKETINVDDVIALVGPRPFNMPSAYADFLKRAWQDGHAAEASAASAAASAVAEAAAKQEQEQQQQQQSEDGQGEGEQRIEAAAGK